MALSIEQRLTDAERLCQLSGARLTSIRKHLLALIYTHEGALSAYELLRLLRETHPKAESMTVYRALDFLQKQHLVHRVASKNTYMACETPQHLHQTQLLLCERCGHTQEIHMNAFNEILQAISEYYQFDLTNSPIELTGICQACHKNE